MSQYSQSRQTFLFFLKSPNLMDLVTFSLQFSDDDHDTVQSSFSQRILKCRELIFTDPDIVATPDKEYVNQILAVLPKCRIDSQEFRQKLDKMGLTFLKLKPSSPLVLQECLQYTITAKLAPQWNTVKHLLVQGRDFLTKAAPLRAVCFDTIVNDSEITLCVKPTCIRLPAFKIENFKKINESSKTSFIIDEKCNVLPSLKVGKAVALSKHIAVMNNTLKNYTDLKKYWKNMYGYRLPDVPEQDIWYVNIIFNMRWAPLTYPHFCIRPYGMTEFPRVDPHPTLQSFIADFCKKVGSICREKCQVLDFRASFPLLRMYPADEVTENATPKLGTTYTMIHEKPYRSALASRTGSENSTTASLHGKTLPQNASQTLKCNGNSSSGSNDVNLETLLRSHHNLSGFLAENGDMYSPAAGNESNPKILTKLSLTNRIHNVPNQFIQKEPSGSGDNRFFKKLGAEDLSFLSSNFENVRLERSDRGGSPNDVKPRFVPAFQPRHPQTHQLKTSDGDICPTNGINGTNDVKPRLVPTFQPRKPQTHQLQTSDGCPTNGIRNPKSGICNPKSGICNPKSGIRNPKNGICNPNSGICNPKSGICNPKSGICNPKSGICNPNSGTCNPKSGICNPNSGICNPNGRICNPNRVEPRFVPRFKPRKPQTLPEMFAKVKSTKRKLDSNNDSKKIKGSISNSSGGGQNRKSRGKMTADNVSAVSSKCRKKKNIS